MIWVFGIQGFRVKFDSIGWVGGRVGGVGGSGGWVPEV